MTTVNPNEKRVDAAIAEYFEMVDRGQSVDPNSFVDRYQDIADELWSFFEAADVVESMAGPTVAEYSALVNSGDTSKLMETGVVSPQGNEHRRNEQRPHQTLDVPSRFGRYHIESELGQGAMGSVYLAYDQQLDRQVAIKIPKFDDAGEPEMIERFYREARAAATLRSPHICPVFDVDKIGDVHFIAMAFIDGEPLSRCVRQQRLSSRQIATVLHKLAFALQKAHDNGVIHRDLKPSNIMIDSDGEPVVMDFGLARRNAAPAVNGLDEGPTDIRSTSDGAIIGSPAYMSPEQVMGDTEAIGPASDVYSLGVVMYEMLTGRLPYEGSVLSVIGQIVAGDLKSARETSPNVDPHLASICEKMLERKVEHRFPSMSAVAAALGEFLERKSDYVVADLAPQKKPNGPEQRVAHQFQQPEVSNSRVLLAIGALLFACLLGVATLAVGFCFFLLQKPDVKHSRQQAKNLQQTPKPEPVPTGDRVALTKTDNLPAEIISLDGPQKWTLKSDPPVGSAKTLPRKSIRLTEGGEQFWETVSCLGFNGTTDQALLVRAFSHPGKPKTRKIERVDLAAGKTLGAIELPAGQKFFDADPSLNLVLARSDDRGFGKNDQMDVWDVSGLEPRKVKSWKPQDPPHRDANFARFVGKKHIVTVNHKSLVLWTYPELKAVYSIKVRGNPAINAGGKYMAVATNAGMKVLETLTGKVLGELAGDNADQPVFAFRADGLRLAMLSHGGRLQVWDCEKGERIRDIFLDGQLQPNKLLVNRTVQWVSDEYVLIDRKQLVDIQRRILLWRYEGINGEGGMFGGSYWCSLWDDKCKYFAPFQLPHSDAAGAVSGLSADALLVVKPGSKITLNVKSPVAPDHATEIANSLTSRLDDNGMAMVSAASIVVEAVSEKGKSRPMTYHTIGQIQGGSNTVQVTDQVYRITIKQGANVLWEKTHTKSAPTLLRPKEGQSIQEAIDELTKPDPSFFLTTPLPAMLARPGAMDGAYGKSNLTPQGIQSITR